MALARRRVRSWRPATVTGVLILVSLSLMLLDLRGGPTDTLRAVGRWVGGPIEAASSALFGPVATQVLRRPDEAGLQQRIAELTAENQRLQLHNDALAERLAAAPGAAAIERYAAAADQPLVTARVVAAASEPLAQAVTLDVGADQGISAGDPVVAPAGLVGRVLATGPSASTVQLVTDPASAVAIRLQAARQAGLAQGAGRGQPLLLSHVDVLAEVRPGDRIVTLGSPGERPFPAGIPVGVVRSVTGAVGDVGRRIDADPAVALGGLDRVAVLVSSGRSP